MHSELSAELYTAIKDQDVGTLRTILRGSRNHSYRPDVHHMLCVAAELGAAVIIKELLRCKANVLHVDKGGRRPIHFACLGPSVEALKLIIRGGSPLSLQDNEGASALHLAVQKLNRDMVAFLVKEGATVTKVKAYGTDETPLHVACRLGDDVIVRMILKRCVNANMRTLHKRTPIMLAIEHRHIRVVRTLCEFGVALDTGNAVGNSALHLALEIFPQAVDILLKSGANPSIGNAGGKTPLHLAAFQQMTLDVYVQKAELLVEHRADIHAPDSNGQTPLHSAAMAGNVPAANFFLQRGAHINIRDNLSGDTPLHLAVCHSRNEMIELLIENGADVNMCDTNGGMSPLHRILASRNSEKLKYVDYLIRHGAKLNVVSFRGYTPLDRCVFHSMLGGFSADCLLRLVQAGAYLKPVPGPKSNIQHNSPLCWLTWHGNLPVARFLVESGWDLRHENWIRLRGKNQQTADFLAYIWSCVKQPSPLRIMCRVVIREHLNSVAKDTDIVPLVNKSPLPPFLKRYINLEMEVEACKEDIEAEGYNNDAYS